MPIHEQSILVDNQPELTVICVDNSWLVKSYRGGGVYKAQAKAIALYCEEKIKAHPHNKVALLPMDEDEILGGLSYVQPTRDLDKIRIALKALEYDGLPWIPAGLFTLTELQFPNRRLLVFSGGRTPAHLNFSAQLLKRLNVAVDVVNFGVQFLPKTKKKLLEAFVAAADNNGNSHYLYAPSGSRTSLGQQILSSPLAPGGLPMQEAMKKELEAKKKELEAKKIQKLFLKIMELSMTTTHSSPVKETAAHHMRLLVDYCIMSTSSDKESALLRLKALYASYMTTNLSSEEKKMKKKDKAILRMKKKEDAIKRKEKLVDDFFRKELLYASYYMTMTTNLISEEEEKKKKEKAIRRMKKKEQQEAIDRNNKLVKDYRGKEVLAM